MPISSRRMQSVIRIASVVVAALILFAYEWVPNGIIKALTIASLSVLLAYLWMRSMSVRSLNDRRRFLAAAPRLSEIGKGVCAMVLVLPWMALCGLAVRYQLLKYSIAGVLIIVVPAGAFFLLGIFLIGRAYYRAHRDL